jgi:predicted O-methyltransferase YrrM
VSDAGGKYIQLTDELHDYVVRHGAREDATLAQIRADTAALGAISSMQISPDQGSFMTLLVRMIGARRALELGTFTGYSAICIARGLAEGGTLIACELEQERADQARANFGAAGVSERIDVRVGPAAETLAELRADGVEPFDFAFIDADKVSYPGYYETCLELLRPGGLIVLDNMLRGGDVIDASTDDDGTQAIADLNARIQADERVEIAMLAVADGITLALKR